MSRVEITKWRPKCNKVEHTKLIKNRTGLGLAEAKQITDAVLEGRKPTVDLPTDATANELIRELDAIGFEARLAQ
jgi:ribosomal protein L7/L12